MNYNEEYASRFVKAIRRLVSEPENLDNLESYLSDHFESWYARFAQTPSGLVNELELFAGIDDDFYWNQIASYMDDDLREQVHAELAPCSEETFLSRYLELDPGFKDFLENELGMKAEF